MKLICEYLTFYVFYNLYFHEIFLNFFMWDSYIYNLYSHEIFLNFFNIVRSFISIIDSSRYHTLGQMIKFNWITKSCSMHLKKNKR
jgi:hypothetical protein